MERIRHAHPTETLVATATDALLFQAEEGFNQPIKAGAAALPVSEEEDGATLNGILSGAWQPPEIVPTRYSTQRCRRVKTAQIIAGERRAEQLRQSGLIDAPAIAQELIAEDGRRIERKGKVERLLVVA